MSDNFNDGAPMLREKAGIDTAKQQDVIEIIRKTTKNSLFYLNEEKKLKKLAKVTENISNICENISEQELLSLERECDAIFIEIQSFFKFLVKSKVVFAHVDMDAFFAQIEMRDNPALKDIPMAVGSNAMLATSNYAARKYGVRSAMPGFIAKKLCPSLTIIKCNFAKYEHASQIIHDILSKYDENFVSAGLDEAYVNLSRYFTDKEDWIEEIPNLIAKIKNDIFDATQLTCSMGVSISYGLSKMCTNINKPNGHYILLQKSIESTEIMDFISCQPVSRINGVGNVTEKELKAISVETFHDIFKYRAKILLVFGLKKARWLFFASQGVDVSKNEECSVKRKKKTIGVERTIVPTANLYCLTESCSKICKLVASSLKEEDLCTNRITLKIKFHDFESITRCRSLPHFITSYEQIFNVASTLLKNECKPYRKMRLIGVRVDKVSNDSTKKSSNTSKLTLYNFFEPETKRPPPKESIKCPICQCLIFSDEKIINQHLDECLTLSYINNSDN